MVTTKCPQCGAPLDPGVSECRFCGEKFSAPQAEVPQQVVFQQAPPQPAVFQQAPPQQVVFQQAPPQPVYVSAINPAWPKKSKEAAGILAIFLGGLGIHKFYLGKVGMGILYLLFCWTGIPELAGFIEGIIYLCSDDENFQLKHHVRLK